MKEQKNNDIEKAPMLTSSCDYRSYDDLPLFMDAKQVAAVLGISRTTVYELAREQSLPVIRIGTKIIIPKEKLIEWITNHTEG